MSCLLYRLQIAMFTTVKIHKNEFLKNKPVVLTINCGKVYNGVCSKVSKHEAQEQKECSRKQQNKRAWADDSLGRICMR